MLAALRKLDLDPAAPPVAKEPAATFSADAKARIEAARRIWRVCSVVAGSPVLRYLATRGIVADPPASLRWAPRCRHPEGGFLPAMVARIDDVAGELIGVHRTFLKPGGLGKAEVGITKAMLGRASGGAVRLAPVAQTLLIGEGIETRLAVMQATAIPAWAALSAWGLAELALPATVRTVIIAADHDANGAGQRAARAAVLRWRSEGRRVRLAMPPDPWTDFNDVLLGRANAQKSWSAP